VFVCLMVFNATFNNISVISCPFLNALLAIIYYDLLNNIIYLLLSINIILRGRDRMVVAFATT